MTTHSIVLRSVVKALDMGTRATLTMVLSRIAIMRPRAAVNAIAYFDFEPSIVCFHSYMRGFYIVGILS